MPGRLDPSMQLDVHAYVGSESDTLAPAYLNDGCRLWPDSAPCRSSLQQFFHSFLSASRMRWTICRARGAERSAGFQMVPAAGLLSTTSLATACAKLLVAPWPAIPFTQRPIGATAGAGPLMTPSAALLRLRGGSSSPLTGVTAMTGRSRGSAYRAPSLRPLGSARATPARLERQK